MSQSQTDLLSSRYRNAILHVVSHGVDGSTVGRREEMYLMGLEDGRLGVGAGEDGVGLYVQMNRCISR
jgi:hypothetical protein